MKLLRRRQILGMNQYRERQVLPPLALPPVRPATASCRLVLRPNHHIGIGPFVRCQTLPQPAVRRIRFVNMYDFPIHIAKLQFFFRTFATWKKKKTIACHTSTFRLKNFTCTRPWLRHNRPSKRAKFPLVPLWSVRTVLLRGHITLPRHSMTSRPMLRCRLSRWLPTS